jgi:hypothetical protein
VTATLGQAVPRLQFQLPGAWLAFDPRDPSTQAAQVREASRKLVGPADDAAPARRRLREHLDQSLTAARAAGAHGLFVCLEVAPDIRLPVTLTVHAPRELRMTPAIGTSPDAVLATLRESFTAIGVDETDTLTRLNGPRASALRLERVTEQVIEDEGEVAPVTRLEVEYWFAVPGSKHVVLALFASPLGELRHALRNLFDAIALAAAFGPEESAA